MRAAVLYAAARSKKGLMPCISKAAELSGVSSVRRGTLRWLSTPGQQVPLRTVNTSAEELHEKFESKPGWGTYSAESRLLWPETRNPQGHGHAARSENRSWPKR